MNDCYISDINNLNTHDTHDCMICIHIHMYDVYTHDSYVNGNNVDNNLRADSSGFTDLL